MFKTMKFEAKIVCTILFSLMLIFSVITMQQSFLNEKTSPNNINSSVNKNQLKDLFTKYPQLNPKASNTENSGYVNIPFTGFIENMGQNPSKEIQYYYQSSGSGIAFSNSKIYFIQKVGTQSSKIQDSNYMSFFITFPGSNMVSPVGVEVMPHKTSFFISTLKLTNVRSFKEIWYYNIYKNIDLRYYMTTKGMKYEFIVNPGGNPNDIQIQASSNINLQVQKSEVNYMANSLSNNPLLVDSNLYVFRQDGSKINSEFMNLGVNSYGVKINQASITNAKNSGQKIIIDPYWLYFNTYIGGSGLDFGEAIAIGPYSNIYVAGYTSSSTGFPLINPANGTYGGGSSDVFVMELNPSGTSIIWSTYLGGSGTDDPHAIAVDPLGFAYVTGSTTSSNFPLVNAYDSTLNGTEDIFVAKIGSPVYGIVFSTYLGGTGDDIGNSIAVSSNGRIYITGSTTSSSYFPLVNAYNSMYGGATDAFVTQMTYGGSVITIGYSTYLGGSGTEVGNAIAVDSSNNVYITGTTSSGNFPLVNANTSLYSGSTLNDIFLTKINSVGSNLLYSTYIGGSNYDVGNAIAIDSSGNTYITGMTESNTGFPLVNAYDSSFNGAGSVAGDAFVLKINSTGNGVLYSTYIGGSDNDWGYGIAVDSSGNAYVTGTTESSYGTLFPTGNAIQSSFGAGSTDAYIFKLNSIGNGLIYSSLIGGSGTDQGSAIAIDSSGNAYVTGYTQGGLPDVSGYDTSYNQGADAFILKYSNVTDDTNPVVSITSPTYSFYGSSSVTLSYSVIDSYLNTTTIYLDSVANFSSELSGSALSSLSDGQHNITIFATDLAGNHASATVIFTVDTTPPAITITSPTASFYNYNSITFTYNVVETNPGSTTVFINGTSYAISSGNIVNFPSDGYFNLTIYSVDSVGNNDSASVFFTVDTTNPIVTINSPNNTTYGTTSAIMTYSVTDTNLNTITLYEDGVQVSYTSGTVRTFVNGPHNFTVVGLDKAGNTVTKTVIFTVDTSVPSLIFSSPSNNAYINSNSVTVDYSASNYDTIEVFIDSTIQNTTSSYNPGFILSSLSDGPHNVTIKLIKTATSKMDVVSLFFTIDTTNPSVSITSPTSTGYKTGSILFTYTVNDINLNSVIIYRNNIANTSAEPSGSQLTLSDGNYNITIVGVDLAGNTKIQTTLFYIDTTNPTVTVTSPTNSDYDTSSIALTYSTSDAHLSSVIIYDNGVANSSAEPSGFQLNLVDGSYNITIYAVDSQGNSQFQTELFYIDTTNPVLTLTYPANTTYTVNPVPFSFSATDLHLSRTIIYINGVANTTSLTSGNSLTLANGYYNLTLYAVDSVGNSNSLSIYFTINVPSVSTGPTTTAPTTTAPTTTAPITTTPASQSATSNGTTPSSSPGFEVVGVLFSMFLAVSIYFKRRKKEF